MVLFVSLLIWRNSFVADRLGLLLRRPSVRMSAGLFVLFLFGGSLVKVGNAYAEVGKGATVSVRDQDDHPISGKIVFLRELPLQGPFDPDAADPIQEWTAVTDNGGVARFDSVKESTPGTLFQATVSHNDYPYISAKQQGASRLQLAIRAIEPITTLEHLSIQRLRNILQIWEDYLVFTQMYLIKNDGNQPIDIRAFREDPHHAGLPIRLPTKAKGITVTGVGSNEVVQSTVYWSHFLQAGEVAHVQIQFSVSAKEPTLSFQQKMDYRTEEVEFVIPIQTEYRKIPRLDSISLVGIGFKNQGETGPDGSPLDLRPDMDFKAVWGKSLSPGESYEVDLSGLPFHTPKAPLIVFFISTFVAMLLFGVGFARHRRQSDKRDGEKEFVEEERARILALIEEEMKQHRQGMITDDVLKRRLLPYKRRLALLWAAFSVENEEGKGTNGQGPLDEDHDPLDLHQEGQSSDGKDGKPDEEEKSVSNG